MKIAYQGVKGAYSESAAHKHFGKEIELQGFRTFEETVNAVKNEEVTFAILPFENTIAGSLAGNYDLLLKEDLVIIAEVFMKIDHNLLSLKNNRIEDIKKIYSHPHAIEQCREFLRNKGIEAIPTFDTAGSAKIIKENNNQDEAAIASELCSKIYDLDVLEKDIGNNKHNTTKFFVISKMENVPKELKREKTSIAFKTKHFPGALVNTLQRLAKNDINLTKLESRPIPQNPWEYVFFADFEGGTNDENVQFTLKEMEATSLFLKVLGSYPKGEKE